MLPKQAGGFQAKYRNCAEPLRGNSARLFNPEHVIEVAAGCRLASVRLSIYFKPGNPSCFLYFRPRLLYVTLFSLNFLRPEEGVGERRRFFARQHGPERRGRATQSRRTSFRNFVGCLCIGSRSELRQLPASAI